MRPVWLGSLLLFSVACGSDGGTPAIDAAVNPPTADAAAALFDDSVAVKATLDGAIAPIMALVVQALGPAAKLPVSVACPSGGSAEITATSANFQSCAVNSGGDGIAVDGALGIAVTGSGSCLSVTWNGVFTLSFGGRSFRLPLVSMSSSICNGQSCYNASVTTAQGTQTVMNGSCSGGPDAGTGGFDAPVITPDASVRPDAPIVMPDAPVATPDASAATPDGPVATPDAPLVLSDAPPAAADAMSTVDAASSFDAGVPNNVPYGNTCAPACYVQRLSGVFIGHSECIPQVPCTYHMANQTTNVTCYSNGVKLISTAGLGGAMISWKGAGGSVCLTVTTTYDQTLKVTNTIADGTGAELAKVIVPDPIGNPYHQQYQCGPGTPLIDVDLSSPGCQSTSGNADAGMGTTCTMDSSCNP